MAQFSTPSLPPSLVSVPCPGWEGVFFSVPGLRTGPRVTDCHHTGGQDVGPARHMVYEGLAPMGGLLG